jgi:hypothetical protein
MHKTAIWLAVLEIKDNILSINVVYYLSALLIVISKA